MRSKRVTATLAAIVCLAGCAEPVDEPDPEPGELQIGLLQNDGDFMPLEEGEPMAVVLGANGLNMVVPSLRAVGIDPRGPDPSVLVEVGGIVMAADIEGSRVDMEETGESYTLWDLRVPFQTNLCCYVCREGRITATIRDRSGRDFIGEVTVRLERGGCPDLAACCGSPGACPDPSMTQICE